MMQQTILDNEKGRITAGTWVFLLIIAVAVVVGSKAGPPWIDYFMIKDKITNFTKMTNPPEDTEIRDGIRRIVNERQIPLDVDQDVVINRDGGSLSIAAEWTVTVQFPGGHKKDLQFSVYAER